MSCFYIIRPLWNLNKEDFMEVPVELKIKYLSRRLQEIEQLRLCVEQDYFVYAQRMGHIVKGNAQTFGVPQIAPLAVEIETAAIKQDKAQIEFLTLELESFLQLAQNRF